MRILALCTGNTCRSPMLMTLLLEELRKRSRADVSVESAGTGASGGEPASPEAVATMARRGLDLRAHRNRNLLDLDIAIYDRVYAMTSGHAAYARSRGVPAARLAVVNAAGGGIPDPFGGGMADYEACALALEAAAKGIVGELAAG